MQAAGSGVGRHSQAGEEEKEVPRLLKTSLLPGEPSDSLARRPVGGAHSPSPKHIHTALESEQGNAHSGCGETPRFRYMQPVPGRTLPVVLVPSLVSCVQLQPKGGPARWLSM